MIPDQDQERRITTALILCFALFLIHSTLFPPPAPPPPETDVVVNEQPDAPEPIAPSDPVEPAAPVVQDTVPARTASYSSRGWAGTIEHTDGAITNLQLDGYSDQIEVTPVWTYLWQRVKGEADSFEPYKGGDEAVHLVSEQGSLILAGAGDFDSEPQYRIRDAAGGFDAVGHGADGLIVTKSYRPGDDPHDMHVSVRFENTGSQPIEGLWLGAVEKAIESGRFDSNLEPIAHIDGDYQKNTPGFIAGIFGRGEMKGLVSFFGIGDRYFISALIPSEPLEGTLQFEELQDGELSGGFLTLDGALQPGATRDVNFTAYVGPKELSALGGISEDLEDAVEFGIFGFFSNILLFLLKVFQKGLVNWGLSIIALTFLVKTIFFPLTHKGFKSSQAMKAIQPQMKEINEKYKDDPQLKSQETMKLFTKHGVNPLGGCFPMLVQMPVWFALYRVLWESVELYNSQFLYLEDLTLVDPYGILPTLVGVLFFAQQKLTPTPQMDDPAQLFMLKAMPFLFTFMMYPLPAGLVLYITVNTTLSIGQMWFIKRSFDNAPVPA